MASTPSPGMYTPQVNAQEALPRRVSPQAANTSTIQGEQALAGAIGQAGQQYLESQAATYSAKMLSTIQDQWTLKFQDAKANAGDGAPGFTPKVLKNYDADVNAALKEAPSPVAKKFLGERLTAYRNSLANQAMNFEAGERVSYATDVAKQSVDSAGNELLNNPNVFGERLAERKALIDAMPLDPDAKRKLNEYAQQTMARFATTAKMNQDPYGTFEQLSSANPTDLYVKALSPELRLQLMQQSDSLIKQRVNDARQLESLRDKHESQVIDGLVKDGDKLAATGQLTAKWIEQNRDILPENEYRYFYNQLKGPGEEATKSNPRVFAPLLERAMAGEDVTKDAREALYGGQLSQTDYAKIAEKSETLRPGYVKRGTDYISSSLAVSQLNPDPDAQRSKANALDDWREWSTAHPQATDAEARKMYESLADHYRIVPAQKTILTMHVPLYLVGDRTAPDLVATAAKTKEMYESGQLTREEYGRQMSVVQQWMNAYKPKKTEK